MRKAMVVLVVTMLAGSALAFGQVGDADKVLDDMRAALGGADKLAAVTTLTATGIVHRVHARGSDERGIELAMELPATFVGRRVIMGEGPTTVYLNRGFEGDGVIDELDAPPDLNISGLQQRLAMRQRGSGDDGELTPEEKAAAERRIALDQKRYFARVALGLFGSSFEVFPLQFSYVGLAESPDGSAHAIDVRGAEGFEAQLFVDAETSLPLMLRWSERTADDTATTDQRFYYSDFRNVDDLNLPHTFQWTVDGEVREETTFEEIRINPEIDRGKFGISR